MASQLLGIKTRFTNDLGSPLVGGQVYTYFAGTSTNQDTYSDAAMTVPNTNPVILDDTGSADIFLKGAYRIRVFDASGRFIEEQDNVTQAAKESDVSGLLAIVNTNEETRALGLNGFDLINSFEIGATITQRNQALRHAADGKLYRWAGDLPKTVPVGSTPISSGGMGDNAWLEVSDVTLRQDFLDPTRWQDVIKGLPFVTPENFGARAYPFDSTQAFITAAQFARDYNLPFVANNPLGYAINSSIDFYTDTKISKVIMPNNGNYNTLRVKTMQEPDTVAISTLSGLNEFSKKVTGLPDYAVGRYVHIETDQVLTERNNAPGNIPYNKLTAFKLLTSDGDISPSLDMTIASTGVATVKIFKPESRINFTIGVFETVGSGLNHNSIIVYRDDVTVQVGDVIGQTGFRTFMSIAGNNTEVHFPVIKDAVYTGLGYGISIGLSCDTLINNMQGGNCRTALDGRHGANVTVTNSKIENAGSHWGNNYLFKDCDINAISWSGKDLKIKDGSLTTSVYMRSDISLCTGVLDINGTTLHTDSLAVMPSNSQIADFYTEPRRSFDVVKMRNIECTNDIRYLYGGLSVSTFAADHIAPRLLEFENINAPNSNRLGLASLILDYAIAFDEAGRFRARNINAKLVSLFIRGFSKYTSSFGYDTRMSDCGKTFIHADASAFSKFKLIDSTLVGAIRINDSVSNGNMHFDGCILEHDATLATSGLFHIPSTKSFTNCEFRGEFFNGGSVNGYTIYSIGCRAAKGATGYPTPLGYFASSTLFEKDYTKHPFTPEPIPPNGYIRTEVTYQFAALGDLVNASYDKYNAGVEVTAQVSSIHTVSVLFKNLTSEQITLPAGNITVSK